MREAADDRQTAEREAALNRLTPFLDRQMALYFEASALAGRIATSKESPEKTRAIQRFKELYWGELAMVENKGVQQSTVAFWWVLEGNRNKSKCLQEYRGRVAAQEEAMRSVCLRRTSLDLARAARASLIKTWKPGLGVLDILRDP